MTGIEQELKQLEDDLLSVLENNKNQLFEDLKSFVFARSKRLRPKIMFLILKMLNLEITQNHQKLALAVELVHNATLIHDDIIDEAQIRRGKDTFHTKFGAKEATLAGDFLLSLAFENLAQINSTGVIEIFAQNIKNMCRGEIDQYFQKNKVPSLDEYLEKSKNKTALLFLCAVKSALLISNYKKHAKEIEEFALNFGLAFQILNDLNSKEDVKNGIYTLPYVLACMQKKSGCDIIELDSKYITEAKNFLDNIILHANQKLMFADNNYKKTLVEIFKNLKDN